MPRQITFKGNPMTLAGRVLKIGTIAPDFKVSAQDLKEVTLSDFSRPGITSVGGIPLPAGKEKIKVITFFPSLDTPVCDLQVKEFNKRAGEVSSEVVIIGISKDLPFAQKRFCRDNGISNAVILSDYKTSSFGINYGVLIRELNLLARGTAILDKKNVLRYINLVAELTSPPDYQDVLKSLKEVMNNPELLLKEGLPSKCKPCEGGLPALPKETVDKLTAQSRGWELVENKKLVKEFKFKDFAGAKYFLDLVSVIAEEQGHHPTLVLIYNKLKISLTTHASGGLTENDFIMAGVIDGLEG